MGQPEKIEDLKFLPGRKKIAYDVNKNPIYVGFAERGKATNQPVWKINRYTYDVDGDVTDIETAYGAWDERTSLTYG